MPRQKSSRKMNPSLYTVPSSNDKGQYRILSVQVRPDLAARIQAITYEGLATGRYPWRTNGEVLRYLLDCGLRVFASTIGQDDDTLRFHQLDRQVQELHVSRESALALFEALTTEIDAILNIAEDRDYAVQRLHVIVPKILKLESETWREWLVSKLRARYKELFTAALPRARLITTRAEDVLHSSRRSTLRKKKR